MPGSARPALRPFRVCHTSSNMNPLSGAPKPRPARIAVIAVHGVGNHEPSESAHSIAKLLMRIPRHARAMYTSFTEECITVPARPFPEVEDSEGSELQRIWAQRSGWHLSERPPESQRDDDPIDVAFMRAQLESYSHDTNDGEYDTVRLSGRRLDDDGDVASDVHIYEMFWTDISRIGTSLFGVFGAFYQLVIHLPYVGGWSLDHVNRELAAEVLPDERANSRRLQAWRLLRTMHSWAQRALTLFAPTLNMLMLAVALSLTTRHIPEASRWTVAKVVLALGIIISLVVLLYHKPKPRRGRFVLLLLLPLLLYFVPPP